VLRIRDVYPGSGHFLSSRIQQKIEGQNKPIVLLPDQMITVVNVHTKLNFSSFSIIPLKI
jgi:hypothetical protein